MEYAKLEPEAPLIVERKRPRASWPEEGSIEFKNYSFRYRPNLPLVLKSLNFSIRPHERIGIVGRTGSGKVN